MLHLVQFPALVMALTLPWIASGQNGKSLCGLNGCQAIDLSKRYTDLSMAKMMRTIKPEALEEVFQNMAKLEILVRQVEDLQRDVMSLFQPVWPVNPGPQRWSMCAEGPCSCTLETRFVSCWRLELLYHVPRKQQIPVDTRSLDLGMNRLKFLHKDSFNSLTELVELDLNDNQLELLPNSLFYDLENLRHLKLQKNRLLYLTSDIFQDARSLRTIDLSFNVLEGLPEPVFKKLYNLYLLNLATNAITHLKEEIFFDLESLEDLDLSENKLQELPQLVFYKLKSLKLLKMNHNELTRLPYGVFSNLFNLKELYMHNNYIESLPTGVFRDLHNLTFLEITSNRIVQVNYKDFLSMGNLRSLFLGQNLISHIQNKTFVGTPKLEKLYLFSNKIESVELAAFSGLNSLSWLLMNNNLLRQLPRAIFRRTPSLRRLQIDSNKFMKLPEGLLDELKRVEQVKLSMNPWHCDCFILYLTGWLHRNPDKIWDRQPKCRGPGDLGGKPVIEMTFNSVCDGQWASMTKIQGRV
ncbi:carboxypeptidase N subunit 2-like [Homarus americanus]|uniref:carboxypeptidase N subunit 2-like n=1 Tax=Homarus americanus TaxID=6706 RepID=UPI001C4598CC|nr:carboxypeptidase N subunit 2-like [Homarus americanus]